MKFILQFFIILFYRAFFSEALEAIPSLDHEDRKKANEIVAEIKQKMKLQIMCLQVV